jgi:hypothetical protein
MLNVIMINVIMINVIMKNVIMLNLIMINVIMLSVIMINVIMLNVIILNVIALSVIMLNVIALFKNRIMGAKTVEYNVCKCLKMEKNKNKRGLHQSVSQSKNRPAGLKRGLEPWPL